MKSRFSSVVLIVSNLQASVKFYRLMGLHINYEGEDVNHVDCMQEGGCMVTLVPEVTVKKPLQAKMPCAISMITEITITDGLKPIAFANSQVVSSAIPMNST